MKLLTKAPRGTQDILPKDSYKWRFLENIMLDQARLYGFSEIRTPVFEHTELFLRSVGEDTDVVQKEMYTFEDKGGRSITLRPEGTASAVRAMLEHGLFNDPLPLKLCYLSSCYRYEKPQSGRFREFRQFGVEMFGSDLPISDAEIISFANSLFLRLGLENIVLEINSIGCKECRKNYYKALKEYFYNRKDNLCETCRTRLDQNPMRILDCKNPECKAIAQGAPSILDFICKDCKDHFNKLKSFLNEAGISYVVNPKIVRGLDYYTKTVFEFVSHDEKTFGLVCGGGGRYNTLVEELGGNPLPALGFGLGLERLLLIMDTQGITVDKPSSCEVYIAPFDERFYNKAFILANKLKEASINCQMDVFGRGLKSQLKYADKLNAKFVLTLGENEINSNKAKLKNMVTGDYFDIRLDENFLSDFMKIQLDFETKNIFKR